MDRASNPLRRSGGVAAARRRRYRFTPTITGSASRLEERALLSVAMAPMDAGHRAILFNETGAPTIRISPRSDISGMIGRATALRTRLLDTAARTRAIFPTAPIQTVTITMPTSLPTTMPAGGLTNLNTPIRGTMPINGTSPFSRGTILRSGLFNTRIALPSGLTNTGIALRSDLFGVGSSLRTGLFNTGIDLRTRLFDTGIALRTHLIDIGIATRDRLFG